MGRGQWAVAAGTRERNEERRGETREGPPMGVERAGRAWAVRLSVASPSPGPDQTLPINQHTGVLGAWPCNLTRGEERSGIASAVVWWALNGRGVVTVVVVVDSQLLHWACLHNLAHA
jgi:hypothetical protein